jgi:putative ABC transport system ATP-binding protein
METNALSHIHFQLRQGELTAIVGASGSGKSTLMNIIGLLDQCTSGQYFFKDQDISLLNKNELADIRNQKIGFIFQSFFLLSRHSVLQNVMLPLSYRNLPASKAKQMALTMLDKMDIAHLQQHNPQQLSGGQQQRVAIARALVGDPEIILADEPTGALDSKTGQNVMDLLKRLNQEDKRTILIITHDKEMSRQCQRVVTIKDGKIKE